MLWSKVSSDMCMVLQVQRRLLLAFASIWGLDPDIVERTLTLSKPTTQVHFSYLVSE